MGEIVGIVFFVVFYKIIEAILEHRLKVKILKAPFDKENFKLLGSQFNNIVDETTNKWKSLKWAIVAICGGIGLMVIEMISIEVYPDHKFDLDHSFAAIGLESAFIGLGFLIYFLIVFFYDKKKKQ